MIKIAKEKRTFATKFKQMLMKETLKSYFGYDSFLTLTGRNHPPPVEQAGFTGTDAHRRR